MILTVKSGKPDLRRLLVCATLFFGTVFVFYRALGNGFLDLDDPDYVTQNPHVKSGLTLVGIQWAFASGASANWHPLTWISLMLDAQFYGNFARGYHFTNILLHALNAVLAFLALRKMTATFWPAAFCAALFAWHPLRVESVAWVAERKDVLSGVFFWLTLLAYVGYAQHVKSSGALSSASKSRVIYIAALLFFALGLMSKPMLVTLPFLLLLLDYWPLQRLGSNLRQLCVEKIPFVILSFVSCVITFLVQKHWGAVVESQSAGDRIANAAVSFVRYIVDFIWPTNLAVVYSLPQHWHFSVVAASVILIVCVTVLVIAQVRQRPHLFVGWFWFLGMLVPVVGLIQVGLQARADRYTYLPIVGLELALIWSLRDLPGIFSKPAFRTLATTVALAACILQTQNQIAFWKEPNTLYQHALVVTDNNYLAECYLGTTLLNDNRFPEAEIQFRKALGLKPDFSDARFKLGVVLAQAGHDNEALAAYRELLKQNPRHALADYNIGIVLLSQNHAAEAIQHFENTLAKKPNYDPAIVALGTAQAKLGNRDAAIAYFKKALEIKPDNAVAEFNFANALTDLHHDREALAHYETALRMDSDFADAHCNYGNALGTLGRTAEARNQFRRALMLNPRDSTACFGLAVAFEDLRDVPRATACYKRVIRLDPDNAQANYNLGTILLNQNQPAEALSYFQNAARLQPGDASTFMGLGLADEKLGRQDEAITNYHRATELSPDSAPAHCCLGIALRRAGKFSQAVAEEETALRLNPDFPGLREQLALARNGLAAAKD